MVCCASTEAVVKTSEDGRMVQVLKQDALTGGYLLTQGHEHGKPLSRADFYQCCMTVPRWSLDWILIRLISYGKEVLELSLTDDLDLSDLPDQVFTGHSLLSLLYPSSFCYERPDLKLCIKRGLIHSGTFNKAVLSEHRGSMLHLYESLYGARAVINWISQYQILVVDRLRLFGFSIGMKDTALVGADVQAVIEGSKRTSWVEAREAWITNDHMSELRTSVAMNNIKALGEKVTTQALQSQQAAQRLHGGSPNGIITAIASGAKGSYANVASMTVMVGQQNVEGKRIACTFNGELGARTLPCYLGEDMYRERVHDSDKIFDRVLESRGRILSPYRKGLNPQEYFFAAQAGREGMIDTAVKTSRSGYLQRRLVKSREDVHIGTGSNLINAHGEVVSFGQLDMWCPAHIQPVKIHGTALTVRAPVDLKALFQQQVEQHSATPKLRSLSSEMFPTLKSSITC
jgi:DNA-directed RNA polymerase beta' subunit